MFLNGEMTAFSGFLLLLIVIARLIARAKNVEAIFECESVVRSMYGTTNTQETPGNRILDITTVVFKTNCEHLWVQNRCSNGCLG